MRQGKKISIIIPVYNGVKYLKETLNSCMCQMYDNYEIIVIDDCSLDNSVELIESFLSEGNISSNEIKFLKNEFNQGLSQTVNKAVKNSSGEYILILGHDDIILDSHLSCMVELFEDPNVVVVHCNASVINEFGELTGQFVTNNHKLQKRTSEHIIAISKHNFICSCGLIIRREAFLSVGGWDENFRNYGEWLLWIKLAQQGNFNFSSTKTAYYRVHSTNISHTFKDKKTKLELNKYFLFCKKVAMKYHRNWFDLLKVKLFHLAQPVYIYIYSKGLFK